MARSPALLAACCALLLSVLPLPAAAQAAPRADIDYRVIKPQPVAVAGRIEVIDFFWYGCPHCNNLQPALERWIGNKPADVLVRRIPAILRDSWAPHARIYYTLEALGESERLHQRVYHGYHAEKLRMSLPEVMSAWAEHNGIERERWERAYNSPEVQRRVEEAARLTREYQVTGTPSLVVNGRYLTSGNMAESLDRMMAIVDGLVHKARSEGSPR